MAEKNAEHASGALTAYIPFLGWIRTYNPGAYLSKDLLAGATIAAFTIPESMAYASLAGLSPQFGLYASMVALFVYLLFGSSRQLSVGTTSALSIMVAGTLGALALTPDEYLAAAQIAAILAGSFAILAGLLRMGFIVNFISESVLKGFTAAAALFIGSSQLSKLFGIEGVQGNFFERTWHVLSNLGETNGWALGLGLIGIAVLILLEEKVPKLPASLIVVLAAIAIMSITNLEERGVEIAGEIPGGLPSIGVSTFPSGHLSELIGLGFGLFLLSYIEGTGIAKSFAARHHTRIDANQELYANGAINVAAGLAQGFAVGGSMSRTAVASNAGAKTPLSGGIAALLVAVVLLFFTGVFANLPEPVLAAVILVAVKGLIDIPALKRILRLSRLEFISAMATFAGVLTFGMLEGILIGAAVSLVLLVYRASRPHIEVLGRAPGERTFASVRRHPELRQIPGTLILRVDGGIFYANADGVKDQAMELARQTVPPPSRVLLDLDNVPRLDIAALDMLRELDGELAHDQTKLRLVGATGRVRDALRADGLDHLLGPGSGHTSLESALADTQSNVGDED